MHIVGLTGGSGAGKGFVKNYFLKKGIYVIETDLISREVTKPNSDCLNELIDCFGSMILNNDGTLNRKALADIVFSDKEKLLNLNRITHKHILDNAQKIIDEHRIMGDRMIVVDAPQLFESGYNIKCDYIISVIADEQVRISRIIERDKITTEQAKKRLSNQLSDEFFIENSDFVIYNNGAEDLDKQIQNIINSIMKDSL